MMNNELRMAKRLRELADGLENGALLVHSFYDERDTMDAPNNLGMIQRDLTGGAKLTLTVLPKEEKAR